MVLTVMRSGLPASFDIVRFGLFIQPSTMSELSSATSPASDQTADQSGSVAPIVGPPIRSSSPKNTLWQDIKQGIDYVRFVWAVARRIRGFRNQVRFVVGIILWKPMLPQETLNYDES